MKNPWIHLPKRKPFLLPEDEAAVHAFNARWRGTPFEIKLQEIPSPYVGDPNAPVVMLNLNPGSAFEAPKGSVLDRFREVSRANLLHHFYDYPYYVLDPALEGTPSGYSWFTQKLRPLIAATGMNAQEISKHLFTVEYFPYSSVRYGWRGGVLPSQWYAMQLVEQAIQRGAIVILMRGKKAWFETIPALAFYPNLFTLRSAQNVTTSKKNLGEEGFARVVEKLRGEL